MSRKYLVEFNLLKELHNEKLSVSPEFFDRLEQKIKLMVEEAKKRASENQRTTVMARDL